MAAEGVIHAAGDGFAVQPRISITGFPFFVFRVMIVFAYQKDVLLSWESSTPDFMPYRDWTFFSSSQAMVILRNRDAMSISVKLRKSDTGS